MPGSFSHILHFSFHITFVSRETFPPLPQSLLSQPLHLMRQAACRRLLAGGLEPDARSGLPAGGLEPRVPTGGHRVGGRRRRGVGAEPRPGVLREQDGGLWVPATGWLARPEAGGLGPSRLEGAPGLRTCWAEGGQNVCSG